MCGISFYFSQKKHYCKELEDSLLITKHRGPDASGVYFTEVGESFIGLGHNRLSIIDLSDSGKQPMFKSGVAISFNGEIYNYLELREQLIKLGHIFLSDSDTEVILAAYLQFGIDGFSKLKGMFAFALLDEPKQQFYIVRDIIGIKPVYLFQSETAIFGCSEIKGLKKFSEVDSAISKNDVFEFFNTGFLYEPSTGYQFIKKLMPGFYLNIDLVSGGRNYVQFAELSDYTSASTLTQKISASVSMQEVADVPLGVFFSGGADSSILAALAKNSELLFAKYDKDPNSDVDLKYSKLISCYLNKELKTTSIGSDGKDFKAILDSFDFVAKHSEELISDYTFWSTYLLSKAARDSGYKVMLSGMGGDEAFAGYPRYLILKYHRMFRVFSSLFKVFYRFKLFPKRFDKKIERFISYCSEPVWPLAYSRLLGYFSKSELKLLFSDFEQLNEQYLRKLHAVQGTFNGSITDKLKLAQHFDLTGFLSHNLAVSDKASMLASIELRVPLLDEHVVAYGFSLKSTELIVGKSLKYPLRELLRTLIPERFIDRPKTGFNPPLDGLINQLGEERILAELKNIVHVLSVRTVDDVVNNHFSGKVNNTYKIWQLLYFSRWLKAQEQW